MANSELVNRPVAIFSKPFWLGNRFLKTSLVETHGSLRQEKRRTPNCKGLAGGKGQVSAGNHTLVSPVGKKMENEAGY